VGFQPIPNSWNQRWAGSPHHTGYRTGRVVGWGVSSSRSCIASMT
jgi:hypothetical protein